MRAALKTLVLDELPDHLGLAYERFAPINELAEPGKIDDDRRPGWLTRLAKLPVAKEYPAAFRRWEGGLLADGSRCLRVRLRARLLLGHGNSAPTEVGLTVHHTWGVPVIPGSALKGLLSHYVDAVYGPEDLDMHPMAPDFPAAERERAPFRATKWRGGAIEHGPGAVHRALFGAPAAEDDERFVDQGAGETQGEVIFHDALYVPAASPRSPWSVDVMTVHQKRYYDSSGERGPSDHDRPQPISFLTVGRDTEFLIALSGRGEWTKLAETLLLQALEEWGVGAKTAAGYGRLIRSTAVDQGPQAAAPSVAAAHGPTVASRPRSPIVERLRSWLAQKDPPPGRTAAPTQRERLQELRERWLDDLLRQDRPAKDEAIALLKKHIKSEKLRLDLELLLDQLRR